MLRYAICLFVLLSGCASAPYWERTWEGAVTAPEIIFVNQSPWGKGIQGWTVCNKIERKCQVMVVSGTNKDCVIAHEMRHVAGWDHPNYPRAFICNQVTFSAI